jgi:hypothetical protein
MIGRSDGRLVAAIPDRCHAPRMNRGRVDRVTESSRGRLGFLALLALVASLAIACSADPAEPATGSIAEELASDLRFHGASDFYGQFTRRTRDATIGGQSSYVGVIATLNLPRADVERLLPPQLALARPKQASVGVHPVVVFFGTQTNGATLSFGFPIPTYVSYREAILLVPFVTSGSAGRWHNYATRMYLDYEPAKIIGEDYGYKKELAWLQWLNPNRFAVRENTETGRPLFTGRADSAGPLTTEADVSAQFADYRALKEILEMPVAGQLRDGTFACSYFELGYDRAKVMPVSVGAEFHQPLTAQMGPAFTAPGPRNAVPGGAFYFDHLRWRLAWPEITCTW